MRRRKLKLHEKNWNYYATLKGAKKWHPSGGDRKSVAAKSN
jgi:hypothetical protein